MVAAATAWSFYISERANENLRPRPLGGEGGLATGAFTSRGGTGEGVQAQRAYPTASVSNTNLTTSCTNKSGA